MLIVGQTITNIFFSFLLTIFYYNNNANALVRPLQESSFLKILGGSKSKSPLVVMIDTNKPKSSHHLRNIEKHHHHDVADLKNIKEPSSNIISLLQQILAVKPENPSASLEETKELLQLGLQAYRSKLETDAKTLLRSKYTHSYKNSCESPKEDSCESSPKDKNNNDTKKKKGKRGTGKTMPPAKDKKHVYSCEK